MNNKFYRNAVLTFANAMEHTLRANDHKGGWSPDNCSEGYLEDKLEGEMGEYFAIKNKERAGKDLDELVDIANFCMMLYHRRLINEVEHINFQ